jgi:hypothetical protein
MMTLTEHRARARRRKKQQKRQDELVKIIRETRVLHENKTLALLYGRDSHSASMVLNSLGTRRVQLLHEVWSYNPTTKRFQAFKNRGLGQGLVQYLAKMGINVKPSAARISDAAAMELRFAEEKDEFLFKLKYGHKEAA